jgi:hypothetical protein
VPRTET